MSQFKDREFPDIDEPDPWPFGDVPEKTEPPGNPFYDDRYSRYIALGASPDLAREMATCDLMQHRDCRGHEGEWR